MTNYVPAKPPTGSLQGFGLRVVETGELRINQVLEHTTAPLSVLSHKVGDAMSSLNASAGVRCGAPRLCAVVVCEACCQALGVYGYPPANFHAVSSHGKGFNDGTFQAQVQGRRYGRVPASRALTSPDRGFADRAVQAGADERRLPVHRMRPTRTPPQRVRRLRRRPNTSVVEARQRSRRRRDRNCVRMSRRGLARRRR
jgi:hypothetical protein